MISELKEKISAIEIVENGEDLVVLSPDDFVLDPKYFEWQYSKTPEMKLRTGALTKLREARNILREKMGVEWNFKIWDCYRTLETQQLLFDAYSKELRAANPDWSQGAIGNATQIFVAFPSHNPKAPAPHNTGGAVDLTIVDENGKELPMGTDFDEFVERSYTDFYDDSQLEEEIEFNKNRALLRNILESVGFVNYAEEWWHFSYGDQAWAYKKAKDYAIYSSKEI